MKKQLIVLTILITKITSGQISSIVVDSITNEKIPFVNIWVEHENTGTTSNEQGEFTLNTSGTAKTIVFSSIGYETKKVSSSLVKNVVKLSPKINELQEISVKAEIEKYEKVVGEFKKSEINHYFGCGTPWIIARFFEYNEDYSRTPFLEKIRFLTNSDIKNATFNIRLYSIDKRGQPGDYIYNKNILGTAKKGKKITEIDLSELNIRFPEKGFFIAVEWFIVESNKSEYPYTKDGSNKKLTGISYQPTFGTIPSEIAENSWIYSQGIWSKVYKNAGPIKRYKDKYSLLAIELTLSN